MQERIKILDRREPAQPAGEAGAATLGATSPGKDGAVADKIENGVDPFPLGDAL
jgi:hypothetical protein